MKKLILSWLLHHANRYYKSEHFYKIKAEILKKYGQFICYEFQEMPGKTCYACFGSGIYHGDYFTDTCNRCYNGWFIKPHWNVLEKIKFGSYIFHKPFNRIYTKPETGGKIIEGYISHNQSKYSYIARMIIFMLYDLKGYRKNWRFDIGNGWHINKQWLPKNIINNAVYLLKHGKNSYPFSQWKQKRKPKIVYNPSLHEVDYDDLPF